MSDTRQPLPPKLPNNFLNQFEKLSREQAGHLRHFHNLATRRDGDWGPMGSQEPGQEWLDAYRYQLATMAYAAGAAHYHRMPALRSPFKSLMECLIRKMLHRDVWGYWFLTSHSGKFVDPDIEELRKPRPDPIIIGMRYNDIRDGTNVATDLLKKYTAAWEAKGMAQENGLFIQWYSPKQGTRKPASDLGFTAWAAAFMNAWNPILAHQTFQNQATGFLSRVEGNRVNVNPGPLAFAIRELVEKDGVDPDSSSTIQTAQELVEKNPDPREPPFSRPLFGYVLKWVSEVGDKATLDGLLNHVDRYFQPTWEDGGLYYPVKPQEPDSLNWTEVEPLTGNSAVGYARLNVFDGQRKMWTDPWTPKHVSSAPFVKGINLGIGRDFLRGCWNETLNARVVTMRSWDGTRKKGEFECCNLPVGQYGVYHNGELTDIRDVTQPGDTIEVSVDVTGEEFDMVLLKA
ncbi:hypothetical protein Asppvi_000024 [Aspergillus pseudoviridinutans]|uniref:Linalool dehydratase/isomerase domain-containing protein n=1 Tax=Aspergillus pseudoviridinutans TaxID=1517512 RepID=A0A9P3B304_9EURO|nr:uncharacterized protein Asppvi_000024 [Aspergillus pseudoviridinutans]GIJ81525.1 hypothetical protein Asppvi_000024 [Aspergillus pseudoviridinutans]